MAQNFEIIVPRDTPLKTEMGLLTFENIVKILKTHNCEYIIAPHPVDEMSNFNHYHVGIHTTASNVYATIAKWFGLPVNAVQGIRKKFKSTYALYLIHYNQDGKTPIDTNLIVTNFGLDYDKLIKNVENRVNDDELLNALATGEITEYNLYKTVSAQWCRTHIRQIEAALQVRSKIHMVSDKERNMEVCYITGDARTGKSYLAKKLCATNNLTYYVSSNGEHPFDDYLGQDAVILDDIRPSHFKFSELLKILDNHMTSKVSARYHNVDLNCKVIYLTSVLPIDDFYRGLQECTGEAKNQLHGRINTYIQVTKDFVTISVYDDSTKGYTRVSTFPNPILTDKDVDLLDFDKRKQVAFDMFKGLADLSNYAADVVANTPDNFTQVTGTTPWDPPV